MRTSVLVILSLVVILFVQYSEATEKKQGVRAQRPQPAHHGAVRASRVVKAKKVVRAHAKRYNTVATRTPVPTTPGGTTRPTIPSSGPSTIGGQQTTTTTKATTTASTGAGNTTATVATTTATVPTTTTILMSTIAPTTTTIASTTTTAAPTTTTTTIPATTTTAPTITTSCDPFLGGCVIDVATTTTTQPSVPIGPTRG